MRQLALPFVHRSAYAREGFLVAPSNEEAHAFLDAEGWRAWPQARLALHGEAGSGKTHLLHVWIGRLRRAGRDAALVEASSIGRLAVDRALPEGGIALDDLDTIIPDEGRPDEGVGEEALLHLLNRADAAAIPLVLASRLPASRLKVALPDLRSRLRATLAVGIGPPEDALLEALLARLLAERQLAVPPAVTRHLLHRLPRDAASIRDAVASLDALALEAGSGVTRTVARRLLGEPRAPGDESEDGRLPLDLGG